MKRPKAAKLSPITVLVFPYQVLTSSGHAHFRFSRVWISFEKLDFLRNGLQQVSVSYGIRWSLTISTKCVVGYGSKAPQREIYPHNVYTFDLFVTSSKSMSLPQNIRCDRTRWPLYQDDVINHVFDSDHAECSKRERIMNPCTRYTYLVILKSDSKEKYEILTHQSCQINTMAS